MAQPATKQSTRELVIARREAMSTMGKAALTKGSAAGTGQSRAAASPARVAASPAAATRPAVAAAGVQAGSSARAASIARREAMSTRGKAAIPSRDRTRSPDASTNPAATTAPAAQQADAPAPEAASSEATGKKGCGCGCDGTRAECKSAILDAARTTDTRAQNAQSLVRNARQAITRAPARAASLARREAMSTRGKAGISKNGMSEAQTARAGNPNLSSRDLAKTLREQRSRNGGAGQKKSEPCGRRRPKPEAGSGAAQDAPWKVGASETAYGQTVTGTMVGRSRDVTGDEPSTCRSITGTEYMGADIFREFCQTDPGQSPGKVTASQTTRGNLVTGNRIGRGQNVTGDEPGTCKRVTGNEYVGAKQSEVFCGTSSEAGPAKITSAETRKGKTLTGSNVGRSGKVTGDETGASRELTGTQYMQAGNGKAPQKVGTSTTLHGGGVTGTMVGRRERMTGDEPGSCRDITGDEYIGEEQYRGFCEKTPQPQDSKVGVSPTLGGKTVTGTMTGRGERVTGDEPGTCKSITGTPYASADQYVNYCKPEDAAIAVARTRQLRSTPGPSMTGQQPGVGGKMTGDERGACEAVSGTPYVGADQYAEACPATPADTASPDFPQSIGTVPWNQFSVTSPAGEAQQTQHTGNVTGSRYEQGFITGPFGMAMGKVTGTEEARFDRSNNNAQPVMPATAETVEGRVKSRVTGEGMDAGLKITGDDWDRGDHVTGTEGTSARRRNPTMRQASATPMSAMTPQKRNEEMTVPSSKVTGGSGNTDKGALITYSGGARG